MFSTITSRHVPGQAPGAPGGGTGPGTDVLEREETAFGTDTRRAADRPWQVIVWNDPVNLMSYVSYVFRSYFGFSRAKADALMLQVHQDGKAIVASGGREESERHVQAMHGYGLWATLQHTSGDGA
ncbi:ATP-dependent Clp protease adapter ClpS [Microbacterium sp. A93]|uniref:ATP-dependent Clp protease adapter ClpS n=1 Tax=Microbacterium sp. A93 TaxID=3450716 RepID=UPI003F42DBAA